MEDPEFKWPIKDPKDIVKWESIKDKAETRRKYQTRQRYNEKAARMETKWKQVQSERARVENQYGCVLLSHCENLLEAHSV